MAEAVGNRPSDEKAAGEKTRRSYVAPAIAWDEAWDARANLMASCARAAGESSYCDADPGA